MKKYTLLAFLLFLPSVLGQTIVAPTVPTNTANIAVRNIDIAMHRMMIEMTRIVSARATAFSDDDIAKIGKMYAWLENTIDTASASISDFHYWAEMPLTDIRATVIPTENPAIENAVLQMMGANVNLRISQSNRLNDGLTPADLTDLKEAIAKSKTYVDTFVASDNPLDLSHSNPYVPVVEPMQLP